MNAAASRVETKVIAEDRIARIESDVAEIKDDVKTINIRLNESIVANAREFGTLRADTEKRFGALMVALESNKAETEKGFGVLRAVIESNKSESERNFGSLRAETEKSFASFRAETEKSFGAVRVETEKGFGGLRVEIEKVRTTIESTKFWLIINTVGIAATILGAITAYLHAVKII